MNKKWNKPWRKEIYRAKLELRKGWSFMAICDTVGLAPSAQSSLNPQTWQANIDGCVGSEWEPKFYPLKSDA